MEFLEMVSPADEGLSSAESVSFLNRGLVVNTIQNPPRPRGESTSQRPKMMNETTEGHRLLEHGLL